MKKMKMDKLDLLYVLNSLIAQGRTTEAEVLRLVAEKPKHKSAATRRRTHASDRADIDYNSNWRKGDVESRVPSRQSSSGDM